MGQVPSSRGPDLERGRPQGEVGDENNLPGLGVRGSYGSSTDTVDSQTRLFSTDSYDPPCDWEGALGIAELMACDSSYALFPKFDSGAALILASKAQHIGELLAKYERLEEKKMMGSRDPERATYSKRERRLLAKLESEYLAYSRLLDAASRMQQHSKPLKRALQSLKCATARSFLSYHRLIKETKPEEMCNPLHDKNDKMGTLVRGLPHVKVWGRPLGQWLLRAFKIRPNEFHWDGLTLLGCLIQFFLTCLSFTLVYALRAYGLVGYKAWVAIVLVFFTLFAAFAQWLTGTAQSPVIILACGAMFVQGLGGGN
ncbi:hypothetical protein GQ53DRAFT_831187 [Thozetella sp. PMI_491]|nr:hypothetical protein GQ53DRAFT_831187 [Thozetella sp. PMI_491]